LERDYDLLKASQGLFGIADFSSNQGHMVKLRVRINSGEPHSKKLLPLR